MAKKEEKQLRPVVVTTEHRGVFFGYTELDDNALLDVKSIVLKSARNCVRWSGTRGFIGLAANGPTPTSRVGPKAPTFVAHKVTSVIECTPTAAEAWEKAPWG
jgi:hypothetical protein